MIFLLLRVRQASSRLKHICEQALHCTRASVAQDGATAGFLTAAYLAANLFHPATGIGVEALVAGLKAPSTELLTETVLTKLQHFEAGALTYDADSGTVVPAITAGPLDATAVVIEAVEVAAKYAAEFLSQLG